MHSEQLHLISLRSFGTFHSYDVRQPSRFLASIRKTAGNHVACRKTNIFVYFRTYRYRTIYSTVLYSNIRFDLHHSWCWFYHDRYYTKGQYATPCIVHPGDDPIFEHCGTAQVWWTTSLCMSGRSPACSLSVSTCGCRDLWVKDGLPTSAVPIWYQ